jgi:hypothetical protein
LSPQPGQHSKTQSQKKKEGRKRERHWDNSLSLPHQLCELLSVSFSMNLDFAVFASWVFHKNLRRPYLGSACVVPATELHRANDSTISRVEKVLRSLSFHSLSVCAWLDVCMHVCMHVYQFPPKCSLKISGDPVGLPNHYFV